jgi:pimeloyl-ACP methyl ester carboxylesterase
LDIKIPYEFFGNSGQEQSLFLHGNGFPPKAYQTLLENLQKNLEVYAMYQRPFGSNEIKPNSIYGWDLFKNDTLNFINQNNLKNTIGIGHSMGAVLILMIEIDFPGTFKKIFLLDPVITSKFKSKLYKILFRLHLIDRFHPMIQRTKNKKMIYDDFQEIYKNYRSKKIFSKINDDNLKKYINSIINESDDKVMIKLSKDWENAIYRNGSLNDSMIWDNVNKITTPVYILTPNDDDFGHFNYGSSLKKKNSNFINYKINNSSHLFPLEYPEKISELITSNIKF